MSRRRTSATMTLLVFVLSGLLVMVLVATVSILILRHLNDATIAAAVRQDEHLAETTATGIIQPVLQSGIVRGKVEDLASVENAVAHNTVVSDPIERVLIWKPEVSPEGKPEGKLLYTSEPADQRSAPECLVPPCSAPDPMIGSAFPLSPATTETLEAWNTRKAQQVSSGQIDGSLPQYGFPADRRLLEVAVLVKTLGPKQRPLLFQALLKSDAVEASGAELWGAFLPILGVAMLAFVILQIPLAYRLARRVREVQGDRELLLQRAIDASDLERRRITSDLHDGLVQEFAGLAMSLSANADAVSERDPQSGEALDEASNMVRQGMRSLRSAVMGIYPPTLHSAGLPAALSDLAAPMEAQGIQVSLDVDAALELPADVEPLLFRCAQESVRNIISHAEAKEVSIKLAAGRRSTVLEIVDDGSGFSAADRELAHADGHAGLRLMEDLAKDAGSRFEITSEPGQGTTVRLEVPR